MTTAPCARRARKSSLTFRLEHQSAIVRERARLIGNTQRATEARHQGRIKPTLAKLKCLEPLDGESREA